LRDAGQAAVELEGDMPMIDSDSLRAVPSSPSLINCSMTNRHWFCLSSGRVSLPTSRPFAHCDGSQGVVFPKIWPDMAIMSIHQAARCDKAQRWSCNAIVTPLYIRAARMLAARAGVVAWLVT
jgi:hypothetical protein